MKVSRPLQDYFDSVIQISKAAGVAIMNIYSQDKISVRDKSDGSPLTLADTTSHMIIEERLQQEFPDVPVFSEESNKVSYEDRKQWDRYFLIDPLDGTKEFINRNGEFTVNIALIEHGRPVLGVVFAPVLDMMWYAAEGKGAFKSTAGGSSERIFCDPLSLERRVRIVGSRSHGSSALNLYTELFAEFDILPMGSSLKLCCIADGGADLYPRFGLTSEWDIAAAQCVLQEAGGGVFQFSGKELEYNKENILNPFFVALGNTDEALKKIVLNKAKDVCDVKRL